MQSFHTWFAASRRLALVGLGALALSACGGDGAQTDRVGAGDTLGADPAARAGGTTTAQTPMADTAGITDANIAAILSAANQAEIRPSQLAQQRAQNQQVRQYAQRMITDHTALEDSMQALTRQHNITPQDNQLSRQMLAQTDSVTQRLQGLQAAEFDREYMRFMVQSHQMTLDTIDRQLLQSAQNPQLRTAVEQRVRPAVAGHLQEAQQLQGNLGTR